MKNKGKIYINHRKKGGVTNKNTLNYVNNQKVINISASNAIQQGKITTIQRHTLVILADASIYRCIVTFESMDCGIRHNNGDIERTGI